MWCVRCLDGLVLTVQPRRRPCSDAGTRPYLDRWMVGGYTPEALDRMTVILRHAGLL